MSNTQYRRRYWYCGIRLRITHSRGLSQSHRRARHPPCSRRVPIRLRLPTANQLHIAALHLRASSRTPRTMPLEAHGCSHVCLVHVHTGNQFLHARHQGLLLMRLLRCSGLVVVKIVASHATRGSLL